jgi:hypothetical protein
MAGRCSFVVTWIGVVLLAVMAGGAFNAVIDPYDMLGSPRYPGINALKPRARDHVVQVKTYQIERFRPVTVILGGSRAHIGIDAASPAWPETMRPVYNYGIPGYYTTANVLSLQQAWQTGRLRYAVAFLNFQDFLEGGGPLTRNEEGERRLRLGPGGQPNPERSMTRMADTLLALFTLGAVQDSVVTVLKQHGSDVLNLRTDGSSTDSDFSNAARADGMHDLFAQKHAQEVPRVRDAAAGNVDQRQSTPHLDTIAAIINYARQHGIALTLVIEPSHVELLDLYRDAGLQPRIDRFKVDLAQLVRETGDTTTRLWDFNGLGAWTTEPIPAEGDRTTQTKWFWEPSHYKKPLGDLMLRRMFGDDPALFGRELARGTDNQR